MKADKGWGMINAERILNMRRILINTEQSQISN